jgi:hypothetical protein
MSAVPGILIALSAGILFALGALHLLFTFRGAKLLPRDPALKARMEVVSPVITTETTMWKAWVGFNASHSCGALLFGAVYGYLALAHGAFLFESLYLLLVGLILLAGYVYLGLRYWFSVPFRGISVATVLYVLGVVASYG